MRQEQNITNFREEARQVFTRDLPSGPTISIFSVIRGEEGEYRLFTYVFDGNNKAGTANVPFFVR